MPTDSIVLIGAGGHAKVVVDALRLCWPDRSVLAMDDNAELRGQVFCGTTVSVPVSFDGVDAQWFHVAIGDNRLRREWFESAERAGLVPLTVRHPNAVVSTWARVGAGTLIAAGAVVAPAAEVGRGVIVNHSASIDHDCVVGDFCHLGPGARLCGGVRVADDVLIGVGAVVLPGLSVGPGARVGAGAVVVRDVAPGVAVKGAPAR